MEERKVSHKGTVCKIEDNRVFVVIESLSACATCHGKAMCSADKANKMIEAWPDGDIQIGDEVTVEMGQNLGRIAVFWMFIIPTIIFIALIFILFYLTGKEVLSAILSVLITFGYFGVLSLFRKRISGKFSFRAFKVDNNINNNSEMR